MLHRPGAASGSGTIQEPQPTPPYPGHPSSHRQTRSGWLQDPASSPLRSGCTAQCPRRTGRSRCCMHRSCGTAMGQHVTGSWSQISARQLWDGTQTHTQRHGMASWRMLEHWCLILHPCPHATTHIEYTAPCGCIHGHAIEARLTLSSGLRAGLAEWIFGQAIGLAAVGCWIEGKVCGREQVCCGISEAVDEPNATTPRVPTPQSCSKGQS